jgi:hypothetical protein
LNALFNVAQDAKLKQAERSVTFVFAVCGCMWVCVVCVGV